MRPVDGGFLVVSPSASMPMSWRSPPTAGLSSNQVTFTADFLTMHERTNKPYDEIGYAFVGDGRFNMGRSLLITGAIMGADVVFRSPASIVFDQAENRLHTVKAVLVATLA